jgi:hypothetical protein
MRVSNYTPIRRTRTARASRVARKTADEAAMHGQVPGVTPA